MHGVLLVFNFSRKGIYPASNNVTPKFIDYNQNEIFKNQYSTQQIYMLFTIYTPLLTHHFGWCKLHRVKIHKLSTSREDDPLKKAK